MPIQTGSYVRAFNVLVVSVGPPVVSVGPPKILLEQPENDVIRHIFLVISITGCYDSCAEAMYRLSEDSIAMHGEVFGPKCEFWVVSGSPPLVQNVYCTQQIIRIIGCPYALEEYKTVY